MGPVRLAVGVEFLRDGRAFRVVRQLTNDRFIAEDVKFRVEEELSESQILSMYSDGRLRFASSHEQDHEFTPKPLAINDLDPHQVQIVDFRWKAIEPLTKLASPPTHVDFDHRGQELRDAGVECSSRSLRRYWKAWKQSGGDRLALIPRHSQRGGRGQAKRRSILQRNPALRRIVDEALQSVFLTKARRPISAVVRRVLEDVQRHNSRLPSEQAIPIPREQSLWQAISRKIKRFDPWELDRARWGRQIADRRHAPTSRQCLAKRILERVEIDHCLLKLVVGCEAGPIGQPWLTTLIDYYSRMVVGFALSFEPPSYASVMEGLRHTILPKSYVRERFPRVQGEWPCYGVPEKLVCDRGADLTSRDLEHAAFQLNMELDFNPPRSPNLKGVVESHFDTLNDQLISSLPGRTFRSWERRADYRPDDEMLVPFATLVEVIHLHLVDVYSVSKHPTTSKTRLEMWQESAAEFPPCLPASPDDLVVLLAKRVDRTLSRRGIELFGAFYNSDELMAWRADMAANNRKMDRIQIRYTPSDMGHVWALSPLDNRYIKVPAMDAAMQGMTEFEWRVLRRAIRERFDKPEHLMDLASGRNAIREVVEQTMKKPSRKRRARAARFLGTSRLTSDGDDSSESNESSDDTQPTVEHSTDDIDSSQLDVDDWEVASD